MSPLSENDGDSAPSPLVVRVATGGHRGMGVFAGAPFDALSHSRKGVVSEVDVE